MGNIDKKLEKIIIKKKKQEILELITGIVSIFHL